MDEETWMSCSRECASSEGFATSVATDEEDDQALALAKSFKQLAKLKNVPEALNSFKAVLRSDDDQICNLPPAGHVDGNGADYACTGCDAQNCKCGSPAPRGGSSRAGRKLKSQPVRGSAETRSGLNQVQSRGSHNRLRPTSSDMRCNGRLGGRGHAPIHKSERGNNQ